ncbi:MAG: glycosyltransferase family 4 protein [Candidatus Eremiobacteraeota bacterium]|nr:glycosyltransferase family 4 protein [Candidatus Eremiobacteraeota bacterium]
MRVAVDAQLAVGTSTGIGEYVRGLIRALRACGTDVVALSEPRLNPWRFDRRVLWDQFVLPARAKRSGAMLLHCAAGTVPLRTSLPVIATVHDVAWLRVQSHTRAYARYYFGKFSLERYRRVAAFAVDSQFSRNELLEAMPRLDSACVRVVYPGVAADYCALVRERGDGRTIFIPGTVERRKNLETVIRALPLLPGARIVSVGPYTPYQDTCREIAEELGVASRVEFRGYVGRGEVLSLYRTCAAVAVPSRYEGFGYAAAQALCAGTPCVVSDRASLPEVVDGDAAIVSGDDPQAWSAALAAAIRGDGDARATAARSRSRVRFGWNASAAAMLSAYELALGGLVDGRTRSTGSDRSIVGGED